ncbi:hypothetical protein BUE64_10070 [Corynebacterium diphtheriae subsp. lausannense]|nr:hypothetical protein BUE64_10070 [Corynebacterium diphtheriae subsp. lausannense]
MKFLGWILGTAAWPINWCEVPRVLFLGICLDFQLSLAGVNPPKFGRNFGRSTAPQTLVDP